MEELKGSFENEKSAIKFCIEHGLIKQKATCKCDNDMVKSTKGGKPVWRCGKCATCSSIYSGSIFQVGFYACISTWDNNIIDWVIFFNLYC